MNPLPFGWQGDVFLLPYWISRQRPSSCWLSYRNSEVEGVFFWFFGFGGGFFGGLADCLNSRMLLTRRRLSVACLRCFSGDLLLQFRWKLQNFSCVVLWKESPFEWKLSILCWLFFRL
jgi:hypothetical protein